ncbi:hypothetical protein AOL_s00088g25 [Orbilia oligospora ATCC 24927]|uniref:Uncharacterized protein n=1 Tax=Arthrobotrys oligospora (strain ATCC 24927 / CBS 115.81 / DSM 1491) TaxID=756982 RepID=G1XHR2_ARTOA|nr:hypothetical protein AOL_s00088g25 [Orbilia oligospora ATCC 24927]EGX47310.1 hypothetical protein AOL_s00088g25 [Orbilia oligospora ATCC 24927]
MSTRERRKELLSPNLEYLQTNVFRQPLDDEMKRTVADGLEYYVKNLNLKSRVKKCKDVSVDSIKESFGVRDTTTWKRIRCIVQSIHEEYVDFHDKSRFTNLTLILPEHLFRMCHAIILQDSIKQLPQHPNPIMAHAIWLLCNHIEGTRKTRPTKKQSSRLAAIPAQSLESSSEL